MATKLNAIARLANSSAKPTTKALDRIYGREQQRNAVHHKQKYATGIGMRRDAGKKLCGWKIYNVALL